MNADHDMRGPNSRTSLWDVFMLPLGKDPFTVAPDEIVKVVVPALSASGAPWAADVQRQRGRGLYMLDTVPHGALSPAVQAIHARARSAGDAAGRREFEEGENTDLIRTIVGSRPCG